MPGTTATDTPNEPSANTSKLGWAAGVGFGIGFFVLLTLIVALAWWLVRRRRRLHNLHGAGEPENFSRDDPETEIRELVNGKAQLEDTQVMLPVYEIQGRKMDEGEKQLELMFELDGPHAPPRELAAEPSSNRHEADGTEVVSSSSNNDHEKSEDVKVPPVLDDGR